MMKFIGHAVFIVGLAIVSGCTSAPKTTGLVSDGLTGSNAEQHISAGVSLFDEGKYKAAIPHFESALEIEPANPVAHYELALTYVQMNRIDECKRIAKKGLKNPEGMEDQLTGLLATCYSVAGDTDEAVSLYKSALQSNPQNYNLHFNIAIVYNKQNKNEQAIHHLEESINIKPDYSSAYLALGELHRLGNHRTEALFYFMKFIMLEENTPRTQIAADHIATLPYSNIQRGQNKDVTIYTNSEHGDLGPLDLALTVFAVSETSEDRQVTSQVHVDVLTNFFEMAGKYAENNLEVSDSFLWQYALSDIVSLHTQNNFQPFAHYLADIAGIRKVP